MKQTQLLQNEHIRLRALEPEDLELLYKWENDTLLWGKGDTVSPYSRYALKQYISASHRGIYELKQQRMMIEQLERSETIGAIDIYEFDVHNKKAGIGIVVDHAARGCGYATQALQLTVDYAFGFLGLHQVYAYIAVDNQPSINLFTRSGFICSGILKDWIVSSEGYKDVVLYQKINTK
ncbi:MAG: GNAT family N-acetyltransferase [Tannerellaceae bacterium]|nr:GNAT family N-acetyltransferase [Tannerellaceae bacterium]